jgi:hypothetical protein
MKRFSLDFGYYALYWSMEHIKDQMREKQEKNKPGKFWTPPR